MISTSESTQELITLAAQALHEETWLRMQAEKAGRMIEEWQRKSEDFYKQANEAFDRYSDLVCQIRLKGG